MMIKLTGENSFKPSSPCHSCAAVQLNKGALWGVFGGKDRKTDFSYMRQYFIPEVILFVIKGRRLDRAT